MYEDVLQDFVRECREDMDHPRTTAMGIRTETGKGPKEVQEITLSIIRKALEEELVVAGHFEKGLFVAWSLSPDKAVARIREKWDQLDSAPGPGDDIWFTAPENVEFFSKH